MNREAWFIDTNVIMYARGKAHPYKAACARILLEIAEGSFAEKRGVPVVDTEVFQEILYRYGMEGRWATAVAVCRDLLALGFRVLGVGRPEVEALIALAEKYGRCGVRPRDLVHAAVMVRNGIKKIVTADAHFDLIEEVERIDPLSLFSP